MKINKIINLFLLVISIDILITGTGNWTDYIGINIRKLSLIVICLLTTVVWLRDNKIKIKILAIEVMLLIFLMVWGWIIPQIEGTEIKYSLGDSLPLYGLLFLIPIYEYINRYLNWIIVRNFLYITIKIFALFHIFLFIMSIIYSFTNEDIAVINRILDGGKESINIGYRLDFGVVSGSSIFLFMGLYLALTNNKKSLIDILIIFVAILLTGTRSFGIGAILLFGSYILKNYIDIKRIASKLLFSTYTFSIILLTIPVVVILNYGLFKPEALSRPESDNYRIEQISGMIEKIINNPFFGIGFGGHAELISSDTAPYSYELSILALMMKLGLIGTIYLATIFYMYVVNGYNKKLDSRKLKNVTFWLLSVMIIVFMANTNPYLFSFLGIYLIFFFYLDYRNINA